MCDHKALVMNNHKVLKRKAEHQQSVCVSERVIGSQIMKLIKTQEKESFVV